jgi:hypothetical protein
MQMMKTHLCLRTRVRAGYAIVKEDPGWCYKLRDDRTIRCMGKGWDRAYEECRDNNSEKMLKSCLYLHGDKNWWKAFPGCTDEAQCTRV